MKIYVCCYSDDNILIVTNLNKIKLEEQVMLYGVLEFQLHLCYHLCWLLTALQQLSFSVPSLT